LWRHKVHPHLSPRTTPRQDPPRAECPACGVSSPSTGRRNRQIAYRCPECRLEWQELRTKPPRGAGGPEVNNLSEPKAD
jgi:hypothetical protein